MKMMIKQIMQYIMSALNALLLFFLSTILCF